MLCWRSVDAHFNVLSFQNLLPSIIVLILICTYWLDFWLIETRPIGKAEPPNIPLLLALILLKCIHLAKWFISPAILLRINLYSHVTAYYSPKIFLWMKFSVKQHKEAGENTLTHSVLLVLVPLTPPHFHCIDRHRHLFSLFLWPLCWPILAKLA